ncbi:MAG: c-type cytochrome domain-containing protein [Aeoliella sp.]
MRFSLPLVSVALLAALVSTALGKEPVDFAKQIQPIFAANCAGCHGEEKGLGKLRLHTSEALTASQEQHDDLIAAGKPDESELYARLVLPADDKKRMPKKADPLPEDQIALIKQWIAEGATFTTSATADEEMTEQPAVPPAPERPPLEPAATEAIAAVEELGALVMPIYAGSTELRVSFPSASDQVNDATVAALVPIMGQLVELDLSGTSITDAAAASLAKFQYLDALHLEKTSIGDPTVVAVAPLTYLRYLNLHSTPTTDAGIEPLKTSKSLRKLYLWKTAASYDAAKALEQAVPGLEVNLGWDHPGVVRERLTAELKRVEEQKTKSTAAVAEAEKAVEAVKADLKSVTDREAQINKELEALDNPAEEAPAEEAPAEEKPAEEAAADGEEPAG